MHAHRSDLRAGVLALATVTGLSIIALSLPGLLRERPIEYSLRAVPTLDLTGLTPGSPVLVGGLERGRVSEVELEGHGAGATVRFSIGRDPPLYPGAMARLSRNPISQQANIDFISTGAPGPKRKRLAEGSNLMLDERVSTTDGLLPRSTQEALVAIGDHLDLIQQEWPDMTIDARTRFDALVSAATALGDDVNATWPDLSDRTLALIEKFRGLRVQFSAISDEALAAKEEIERVQAIAADGGPWPRLRDAFERLGTSWTAMRDEAAPVSDSLDRFRATGTRVQDSGTAFVETIRELGDALDASDIVANLILVAGQFSKMYDEVFAAPWRALFPSENARDKRLGALDDLARATLRGAEEARRAQASLRAIVETGAVVGEAGVEALQRLDQALRDIEALEDALWRMRSRDPEQ